MSYFDSVLEDRQNLEEALVEEIRDFNRDCQGLTVDSEVGIRILVQRIIEVLERRLEVEGVPSHDF